MYNSDPIRQYGFKYKEGDVPFDKSILEYIYQCNAAGCFNDAGNIKDGNIFNKHYFEYYDDIQKGSDGKLNIFGNKVDFENEIKEIDSMKTTIDMWLGSERRYETTFGVVSTASLVDNTAWNRFLLQIGSPDANNERTIPAIGGTRDVRSSSYKFKILEMIDINGDGLADQVYAVNDGVNDGIYYRPNLGISSSSNKIIFGDTIKIESMSGNINNLGAVINNGNLSSSFISYNFQTNSYSQSWNFFRDTTVTNSYLSDVNGDGYVDFIYCNDILGCKVLYNQPDDNGFPVFSENRPVGFGSDV
jgi:hypothetical protein